MQMLGSNGSSGVLRIYNEQVPDPGIVYFDKGNPIDARAKSTNGLEAIYSLFGWVAGRFEFVQEDVSCEKTINKSRMEIILDGLRMLDEGKIEKLDSPGDGQAAVQLGNEGQTETADTPSDSADKVPVINGPLVDYSYVVDEESFRDGDDIVQEGNHGDWIWVVLEGTAEIVKQTSKGPVSILGISDGAFLGSMSALLAGNNVRSATARAVGNIQLGMLDTQLVTLRPGDFFGSLPFLNLGQEPQSASVYATNDMKIHAINSDKLTEEYDRLPSMLRNLIEHQATCVSVTSLVMRNFLK